MFSYTQPEAVLDTLLPALYKMQQLPNFKLSRAALQESRTILLIDEQVERGNYFMYLLRTDGYNVQRAASMLDAFTLFLRGNFVPFVILLATEHTQERFFLARLSHQVTQKYAWNPPCIHIQTLPGSIAQLPPLAQSLQPSQSHQRSQPMQMHVEPLSLPRVQTEYAPLALQAPRNTPAKVEARAIAVASVAPVVSTARLAAGISPSPPTQLSPIIQRETTSTTKSTESTSLTGLSIGRYHLQEVLGNGPLGTSYRTYDRLREHDIVLKAIQLSTIPSYMEQQDMMSETNLFQHEIDMLRSLTHPHILAPLACGKSYISGSPFVYKTMSYCAAGSLAAWLYRGGMVHTLSPKEVADVVAQIASALQIAHNHHITYQNFKLSNLLIHKSASNAQQLHILVSDFSLTQNRSFLLKTPSVFSYMAPECWQGQSSPASDQYGLAAVTYELLTGRPPFYGQSEQILRQLHQTMPPQPPSALSKHVSPSLDAVILRALAKKPEERFPSITAFADILQKRGA